MTTLGASLLLSWVTRLPSVSPSCPSWFSARSYMAFRVVTVVTVLLTLWRRWCSFVRCACVTLLGDTVVSAARGRLRTAR